MPPICAVCFESLWEPNNACPAPEGHVQPVEPPAPHENTVTWGKVQGKTVHVVCAGPNLLNMTWEVFDGKAAQAEGRTCDICGKPLDVLP